MLLNYHLEYNRVNLFLIFICIINLSYITQSKGLYSKKTNVQYNRISVVKDQFEEMSLRKYIKLKVINILIKIMFANIDDYCNRISKCRY